MFKLSSNVKEFIEGYKDLIEQNNIKQLFEEAYDGWLKLNNMDVDELVDVLLEIGIALKPDIIPGQSSINNYIILFD